MKKETEIEFGTRRVQPDMIRLTPGDRTLLFECDKQKVNAEMEAVKYLDNSYVMFIGMYGSLQHCVVSIEADLCSLAYDKAPFLILVKLFVDGKGYRLILSLFQQPLKRMIKVLNCSCGFITILDLWKIVVDVATVAVGVRFDHHAESKNLDVVKSRSGISLKTIQMIEENLVVL